jgi:large subunit ribosomal protein L21
MSETTNNFNVIKTGGKQYIVRTGDRLRIEILNDKEYKVGDAVDFNEVLMTNVAGKTVVGAPFVAGAVVKAKLLDITRDPTIHVIKYMPKSRYYKKNGHRQPKFVVEIA